MKTKLLVEIESKDYLEIYPEEGQSDEDFKGKEKELEDARKEYAKELHEHVVSEVKRYFEETIEDTFMDGELIEEYYIEGWDELKDYGIKFKVGNFKEKR